MSAIVSALVALVGGAVGLIRKRGVRIEHQLGAHDVRLRQQVADVRKEVSREVALVNHRVDQIDKHMRGIDDRVEGIERTLVTVARKDDIEGLRIAPAKVDARLEGMVENDRRLLAQLQTQGDNVSDMMKILMNRKDP